MSAFWKPPASPEETIRVLVRARADLLRQANRSVAPGAITMGCAMLLEPGKPRAHLIGQRLTDCLEDRDPIPRVRMHS